MMRQYYAQRFKPSHPSGSQGNGQSFTADSRDKQIGTVALGTIVYIQDGVSPLRGFSRPLVCRDRGS